MRTRHSLLTFGTMILFTIVTMAMALFSSPWLEFWLGKERFGAFRILNDCQGYLTLLELGLGGALAPLIARSLGVGDEPTLRRNVAAGVRAYARVSLVILAVGAALTPLIPRLAKDLPRHDLGDFRTAWVVILLSFLVLALAPFRTIVEARQRGYQLNLLLTAQAVTITGLALVLARAGWGITGQALAIALGTSAFTLIMAAGVARTRPGLLPAVCSTPTDDATRRALRSLSLPTFLIALSGRVSLMTDNLVIGDILGAATVTTFFFTQRLAVLAQTVLQGIGSATWAALAELHARGERETFNRRLIELTRLVALLSAATLGPIVAYNRPFVRLWMGPAFPYGGDAVIAVAALNAYLLALQSLWGWCFSATGEVRRVVTASVVASVINLAASLLLTRRYGMIGPLLGTTAGFVAVGVWYLPLALRRTFGTPTGPLVSAMLHPLWLGLLYTALLGWWTHRGTPYHWLTLAAEMSLAALGFLAIGYLFLLTSSDRVLWRARLRALRPSRSNTAETAPLA